MTFIKISSYRVIVTLTIVLLSGCDRYDLDDLPEWTEYNPPPAEFLEMKLDIPDEIEWGETVELILEVKNTREENIVLQVLTEPYVWGEEDRGFFDFMVSDEANRLHWRYFHGAVVESITTSIPLKPGETIRLNHKWDGKNLNGHTMIPGRYEITGYYEVGWIEDEEETTILDNERSFYTTEPQKIVIK